MAFHLLLVVAVVAGINVLPALGPPTWTVLVFFRFRYPELPAALLVVAGAAAATTGRIVLALAFRRVGRWLPEARRTSLETLGRTVVASRKGMIASLGLFALSPIPSNQLFEAVGLARAPLRPFVGAFLAGRLASYSIYLAVASAAQDSIRRVLRAGLFSPQAIALEAFSISLLVAAILIDWPKAIRRLGARRRKPRPQSD